MVPFKNRISKMSGFQMVGFWIPTVIVKQPGTSAQIQKSNWRILTAVTNGCSGLVSSDFDSRSNSFGAILVVAKCPKFLIFSINSWRWDSSSLVPPVSFDNWSYCNEYKCHNFWECSFWEMEKVFFIQNKNDHSFVLSWLPSKTGPTAKVKTAGIWNLQWM